MKHFKKCCCGCKLRTGTLIIGYVYLVLATTQLHSAFKPVEQIEADMMARAIREGERTEDIPHIARIISVQGVLAIIYIPTNLIMLEAVHNDRFLPNMLLPVVAVYITERIAALVVFAFIDLGFGIFLAILTIFHVYPILVILSYYCEMKERGGFDHDF